MSIIINMIKIYTLNRDQFKSVKYKYLMLLTTSIFFKLNYILYTRHLAFSKYVVAIMLSVFTFIFLTKLIISQNNAIYLIEKYFDNIGLYSIFLALSFVIAIDVLKSSKFKFAKHISLTLIIIAMIAVLLLKSRSAFILISLYVVLEYLKNTSYCINKYVIALILVIPLCIISAFCVKSDSTQGRLFIWKTSA